MRVDEWPSTGVDLVGDEKNRKCRSRRRRSMAGDQPRAAGSRLSSGSSCRAEALGRWPGAWATHPLQPPPDITPTGTLAKLTAWTWAKAG